MYTRVPPASAMRASVRAMSSLPIPFPLRSLSHHDPVEVVARRGARNPPPTAVPAVPPPSSAKRNSYPLSGPAPRRLEDELDGDVRFLRRKRTPWIRRPLLTASAVLLIDLPAKPQHRLCPSAHLGDLCFPNGVLNDALDHVPEPRPDFAAAATKPLSGANAGVSRLSRARRASLPRRP